MIVFFFFIFSAPRSVSCCLGPSLCLCSTSLCASSSAPGAAATAGQLISSACRDFSNDRAGRHFWGRGALEEGYNVDLAFRSTLWMGFDWFLGYMSSAPIPKSKKS